ncbi:MAG: tetratricopeptide repeat protein [Bryobacteraceae bacterium]
MLVTAGLTTALYWSVRLAYADWLARQDRLESLAGAIRLAGGNAQYHVRQAELLEQAGAGENLREAALEAALTLNPRDSEVWMELGLRAEMRGEWARSERCLLEAARVDRTYQPRSTLANYYFRRGDREKFWRWVREALERPPATGDVAPLYRLCWSLTEDAGLILDRAIPKRTETLRPYLSFLLAGSRLEAAEAVAEGILPHGTADDVPLLVAYCDRLLEARQTARATRLWNALVGRGLLGYQALNPAAGFALTNGDFRLTPRSQGFDWRIPAVEGVTASRDVQAPALRLSFSGKQPEQCELLWQYLPLAPAASYHFRFEYQTEGIGPGTGLRWEVEDLSGTPVRLAESVSLAAEDWTGGEVTFTTPARLAAARVVLAYRRAPGTTRISGWIALRHLRLKAISDEARG